MVGRIRNPFQNLSTYKNFKMFYQPKRYFILNANFDKTALTSIVFFNQIYGLPMNLFDNG